jgi:hypothetical protein
MRSVDWLGVLWFFLVILAYYSIPPALPLAALVWLISQLSRRAGHTWHRAFTWAASIGAAVGLLAGVIYEFPRVRTDLGMGLPARGTEGTIRMAGLIGGLACLLVAVALLSVVHAVSRARAKRMP